MVLVDGEWKIVGRKFGERGQKEKVIDFASFFGG
jgi:hypothetical protein